MAPRKKPKIVYIDDSPHDVPVVQKGSAVAPPQVAEVAPSIRAPKEKRSFRKPSLLLSILFGCLVLSVSAAFIFIPIKRPAGQTAKPKEDTITPMPISCLNIAPKINWGHRNETLECREGTFGEGQSIGDLLTAQNIDYRYALQVMEIARQRQLPDIRLGSRYYFIYSPETSPLPIMFVYEPDPSAFVFMNLGGNPDVYLHVRTMLRQHNAIKTVVIKNDLAEEMYNMNSGLLLTRKLEAAVKWKVDLFHLEPGDRFQLLYEETEYEGGVAEIGELLAVNYTHDGEDAFAFSFDDDLGSGYYDFEGRPMKSGFLMAPLEYGRISSSFNLNRLDPIKRNGEIRAHLGTDYAAPEGTPILAVGDGTVMNAENKGGNGNYVKLFHTDSIQTQYLHMSAFGEGIVPGAEVRQGQVIGYVGSTGRSTGPHVCFRYWKNGVQVDHRKEKSFGATIGLRDDVLTRFIARRDSLMGMMSAL
ncbi:MAG TPA: peptidoglycan DD-metalloendopeptidase family protein [Bacteroidia bacterium]|nr:peptidoglycan DD-metalloendopeptidase family protein [Bacteroidia bacterium]